MEFFLNRRSVEITVSTSHFAIVTFSDGAFFEVSNAVVFSNLVLFNYIIPNFNHKVIEKFLIVGRKNCINKESVVKARVFFVYTVFYFTNYILKSLRKIWDIILLSIVMIIKEVKEFK